MLNKNLIREMKGVQRRFILAVLLSFFSAVSAVVEFWSIAHIVNDVFILKQSLNEVQIWFLAALIALAMKMVFEYFSERLASDVSTAVQSSLRRRFLTVFMNQSPLKTKALSIGQLMNVYFEGIDTLDRYYREYVPQLVKSLLIPIVFLLFVFPKDWISGLIMLLTLPLIPFFMILIGKWTRNVTERQWFLLSQLSGYLQDVLRGLETLKILGRSKEQGEKINRVSERYRVTTLKVQRWAFLSSLALELLSTISIALIAVGLGLRLVNGDLMYLPAFFILLIAPEYYQPMRELGSFFHASMDADAAAKDLYAILEENQPAIDGAAETRIFDEPFESLCFQNVSFRYKDRAEDALSDISFTLHKGERLALVGKSGSGKTTLLNLALGFLSPTTGTILLNGKPLHTQAFSWLTKVTLLPQEPRVFSGTLAENITLIPDSALDDKVKMAIHRSGLMKLFDDATHIEKLYVGEDGRDLSGGQKALVAFARAFYQDRSVLFLDEPTDNLDLASEKKVMEAVNALLRDRTSVTIAHRLHTIKEADCILLLENGRITAQGTYDELAESNLLFQSFLKGGCNEEDHHMALDAHTSI